MLVSLVRLLIKSPIISVEYVVNWILKNRERGELDITPVIEKWKGEKFALSISDRFLKYLRSCTVSNCWEQQLQFGQMAGSAIRKLIPTIIIA